MADDSPALPDYALGKVNRAAIIDWLVKQLHFYLPIIGIFILSRALFYLIVVGSRSMLPFIGDTDPIQQAHGYLLAAHYRWDTVHYADLAVNGYPVADDDTRGFRLAFFPLLPLCMNLVARLAGPVSQFAVLMSGILLGHLFALVAFALLFTVALDDTHDVALARRTVLYTALSPLAVFYSVPYTESLFLALSLGFFLAARRRRWLLAGLLIGLATASRLAGFALVPALLIEFWLVYRSRTLRPGETARAACGLLLAPAGLLAFIAYLWWHTGDALAFAHAQAHWHRDTLFPLATLWRGITYALHPEWSVNPQVHIHGVVSTSIVLLFLTVLLVSARRWRVSYVVFGLLIMALALLSPLKGDQTMQSTGRYVMVLFPVMITLASWVRTPRMQRLTLILSAALFMVVSALYAHWYRVI